MIRSLQFLFAFVAVFCLLYVKSKRFREAWKQAWMFSLIVYTLGFTPPTYANDKNTNSFSQVEAFQQPQITNERSRSRGNGNNGLFGRNSRSPELPGNSDKSNKAVKKLSGRLNKGNNDDPSGNGSGNGSGSENKITQPIETKKSEENKYQSNIYESKKKKKKLAEQCESVEQFKQDGKYGGFAYKLDKNGNPIIKTVTKDKREILIPYEQALFKYYHQDVYDHIEQPKNFDQKYLESLGYEDRLKYLKATIPKDKVVEFQIANATSLSTEDYRSVPGFISSTKEPGTLYINKRTFQIHFINDKTNLWRTTVRLNKEKLLKLTQNEFHLFPNAGK